MKGRIFTDEMIEYCGQILTIEEVCGDYYEVKGNDKYWQDWMLEDEAVTEEKQEVEQLNKNDMETKEMTKEEVFVYLGSTKILCASTEETAKVQEKLFELGMSWMDGKNIRKDKYLLFINKQGNIGYSSDIDFWMKDINRRIEPSEILAIQIKEEKPKFDPKSLKAFDKVLVKNDTIWYARFYDMIVYDMKGENEYHTTSGEVWIDCIPYNEETKYLHGNANEAPEFYRI